jgi:hypothetical protein
MKKPTDLRDHLTQWVPDLAANPDKLHLYIDKGAIASKLGAGLGYQYGYSLQIVITDFAESADTLMVPLLVWLQTNQPDLLMDTARRDKAIAFEAEIVDHDKIDIAITLELTERVLVSAVTGGYQCTHLGEPQLPDLTGPHPWSLYLKGELIAGNA